MAAALAIAAGFAHAQVLFQDTFDRPDSRNIDGDLGGVTDNTGSSLPINGVYTHAFIDPLNADSGGNLPQDGVAANGGGAQVLANNLQLAVGAGTSNAYVNHNFINADILTAGAFSVSLDVVGFNQASDGQGGGFAIGMTQAEANSAGDANGGAGASAFTSAFNTNGVVSDFWVALRGSSTVAWGDNSGLIGSANVGTKVGTISANFGVDSFAQGSVVTYEVFHNGANVAVGTFSWTDDNANFIGLDARDSGAALLDNFVVQTSTPPVVPTLNIDRTTGQITFTNELAQPLSLIAYSLTSASGGFRVSNWDTIESQGIDTNDTWITLTDTSGGDVVSDLSEATFGEHTLAPSASIQFGEGAWVRGPFEDVNLEIRDTNGNRVPVAIQYVNGDPIAVGDYNANGMIDSGDWPTLRDNLVSDVSSLSAFEAYLSGDLTGDGMVDRNDFRLFKNLWLADNPGANLAAL
ncbi:MAG: hypothetical protein KDA37_09960, partial [Planctomycetales bacterium]|nr:hypothetical protein [Planctomycetales bacterium]